MFTISVFFALLLSCGLSLRYEELAIGADRETITTVVSQDLVVFLTNLQQIINVYNTTTNTMQYIYLTEDEPIYFCGASIYEDIIVVSMKNSTGQNPVNMCNITSNICVNVNSPTTFIEVTPIVVQDCIFFEEFSPSESFNIYNFTSKSWKTVSSSGDLAENYVVVKDCIVFSNGISYCLITNTWITINITYFTSSSITTYKDDSVLFMDGNIIYIFNISTEDLLFFQSSCTDTDNSIITFIYDSLFVLGNSICVHNFSTNTSNFIDGGCNLQVINEEFLLCAEYQSVFMYDVHSRIWSNSTPPVYNFNAFGLSGSNVVISAAYDTVGPSKYAYIYDTSKQIWNTVSLNATLMLTSIVTLQSSCVVYSGFNVLNIYSNVLYDFIPCFSDEDCDDFIFCNGQEICDPNGFCNSATSLPCADSTIFCSSICNENEGNCNLIKGTSCDNQDFCDGEDVCDGFGNCIHSGNPCGNYSECYNGCQDNKCTFSTYGTNCTGNDLCYLNICDGMGSCISISILIPSCTKQEELQTITSNHVEVIVGAVLGSVIFILIVGIGVYAFLLWRRKQKSYKETNTNNMLEMSVYRIENISILEKLGSGEFGDVYRGYLDDTIQVALKSLKQSDYTGEFQREITLLSTLNHPNIVRLYGVHINSQNDHFMVFEFMAKGSLLNLLHNSKTSIDIKILFQISKQILSGMKYLEANKIIHRDLALRNILVTTDENGNFIIKVSDFGMSRAIEEGYYKSENKKMPIKWCAPEFIQYGKSSSKSDVWSFGICLWEMFSYGMVPYTGWSNDIVIERVINGYRMSPPPDCPNPIYDIMYDCWKAEPAKRPTFTELNQKMLILHPESLATTMIENINKHGLRDVVTRSNNVYI